MKTTSSFWPKEPAKVLGAAKHRDFVKLIVDL
jgi:hypothetical protein